MTDDQHGEGTPQGGGRWNPLPQGDYDDGATAFVQLPEGGIDALLSGDSPLAAPGHGYVPPPIAPHTDATAGWPVPEGGQWPDPNAVPAPSHAADDRFTYEPGATQQWTFEEPAAPAAPGHDVTGQWSIPVAGGDLPDESGEYTTSSLVEQWGGAPPATLPGGAPAPWATPDTPRPWDTPDHTGSHPSGPGPEAYGPGTGYGHPPAAPGEGYTDGHGSGYPATGHAEHGHEGSGHAGAGYPDEGSGHAGAGYPDAGHVEGDHGEAGYSEGGHEGSGHAGTGYPHAGPVQAGHEGAGSASAGYSDTGHVEAAAGHAGVGYPDAGRAEGEYVGAGSGEAGEAEGGHPGAGHADGGHADAAHAGRALPDAGHADGGRMGAGPVEAEDAEHGRVAGHLHTEHPEHPEHPEHTEHTEYADATDGDTPGGTVAHGGAVSSAAPGEPAARPAGHGTAPEAAAHGPAEAPERPAEAPAGHERPTGPATASRPASAADTASEETPGDPVTTAHPAAPDDPAPAAHPTESADAAVPTDPADPADASGTVRPAAPTAAHSAAEPAIAAHPVADPAVAPHAADDPAVAPEPAADPAETAGPADPEETAEPAGAAVAEAAAPSVPAETAEAPAGTEPSEDEGATEDAPPAGEPGDSRESEPAQETHGTTEAHETREPVPDGAEEPPAPLPPHDDHPLASYVLRVNGTDRPVTDAWIGESLLYVLRERLGLAGAKDGCSQGECGACNVQVDGRLVASCLVPAVTTAGSEVRTVEGLAVDGQPSDVQRALARCGAVQCGFCVPGMAMTVHDLLEGNPAPTELETRQALCGNLCRCSGYRGVLEAVKEVVAEREASHAGPETDGDEARIPHQAAPGSGGVHPSAFEAPGAFAAPRPPEQYDTPDPYGTTPPGPQDQQHYGQDGGQA
ncbi:2Fe-2S iron-sulfur cluster-binding protein [Streptomyces nogalater]|uniref:2Fe-2S iron-sulfur cluster-binding protein n=1 Tax=Streptomyces nogalater TaxID=38314 RepID=A0ABW0WKN9_STRNO